MESDLGLYCLLWPICPKTYGSYGTLLISLKVLYPETNRSIQFNLSLWANSAEYKLMIFLLFFPENQSVSIGDHLHKLPNPISWEK